jgi:hypothetical protein
VLTACNARPQTKIAPVFTDMGELWYRDRAQNPQGVLIADLQNSLDLCSLHLKAMSQVIISSQSFFNFEFASRIRFIEILLALNQFSSIFLIFQGPEVPYMSSVAV